MKKIYSLIIATVIMFSLFAQPCTDLFFSEYLEGSSNNKALEIYNPTSASVSLSDYSVFRSTNGGSSTAVFGLSGTLAPGSVFVVANSLADSVVRILADTLSGFFNFNGDDALALLHFTDTIDIIGEFRIDPGASWAVGSSSTLDNTLVRKETVQEGTTNWSLSSTQWYGFLQNDITNLGSHTMLACGTPLDTLVVFSPVSASVNEGTGTYDVYLVLNLINSSSASTVDVELTGGTGDATDINNYATQTVTFNPNAVSDTLTLTITDDLVTEPSETLTFKLSNPTGGLKLGSDSIFTLTIGASDAPVQAVTLSQITSLDTSYQPDSLGKIVIARGAVYGINYRSTGVQFTIHDATDGIQVFSPAGNFGYTVNETDSVVVQGEVAFFNGMTQLSTLDTIYKIGTGSLLAPLLAQDLDESTESELVRLNNVQLVIPSQWDTTGNVSGFSCDITDGVNTWTLRVDEETDIFSTNLSVPQNTFDVIGIGGQFDGSAPYNSGYQILPRYTQDIILHSSISGMGETVAYIYPNPNNGKFIVERKNSDEADIKLFDLAGKLVYASKNNSLITHISVTDLTTGIYFIQIRDENTLSRYKVNIAK